MAGCGSYAKIEGFAFLPVTCFTMALTTFVSQNLGAKQYDRAKKGARFGILCSVAIAELIGFVIYVAAPTLIAAFNSDPSVVHYGVMQARTIALFYFLLAFSHCIAAVLRGSGHASIPMAVMLCVWCLFRVSYITVTVRLIPDIRVIFWAYPLTWSISSVIFLYLFLKGKWVYGFEKNLIETQRKEDKTMDIEMFGKLSDAFGPSGFEEDVIRTIADYCKEFDVENDAMNNLYVRMPGTKQDSRPVIQLDAHLDACGFMVQNIQDNGCLGIIMLGGFHLTSLPAHAVWIRTRSGKMVHGIICAKPVHFMTTAERNSQTLEIEKMYVDVGATGREEVENVFGIHIGDPMMPDVTFEYDAEHEICFGKAFDNRAGCACIVDTMKQLEKEQASLAVNVVGAFAAQEEVGTRGAVVTSQIVKPDLAIVFEGSPSDDFFSSAQDRHRAA